MEINCNGLLELHLILKGVMGHTWPEIQSGCIMCCTAKYLSLCVDIYVVKYCKVIKELLSY